MKFNKKKLGEFLGPKDHKSEGRSLVKLGPKVLSPFVKGP